jgi:hypothetical protein
MPGGLDLGVVGDDLDPLRLREAGDCGALGLDPEPGSALALRRNPVIGDRLRHAALSSDHHTYSIFTAEMADAR